MSTNSQYVFFDGPFTDKALRQYWTIFIGTDRTAPLGNLFCLYDYRTARFLAEDLAEDRDLQLYISATNPN